MTTSKIGGNRMNKTKIERYMPMILSFKGKAESYGLKDKAKLANDLLKDYSS